MRIGYMQTHDGIPYDLDALDEITPPERVLIERKLISRSNEDWRDSEALGRLGTEPAMKALIASTVSRNREVRLRAGEILRQKGVPIDLDGLIVDALRHAGIGNGLSEALSLAARFPSEAIEKALLQGARCADDGEGREVFFPALLLYLHGRATEPFDQSQQAFFQRFRTKPGPDREQVFQELCERVGVDPSEVSCTEPFTRARCDGHAFSVWGRIVGVSVVVTIMALVGGWIWLAHRG
jgi:hypothetical protein